MTGPIVRIYISNESDVDEAVRLIDDAGFKNDLDGYDRIMVQEKDVDDVINLFDTNGIKYQII